MTLSPRNKRELLAASHRLKPIATVAAGDVSDAVADHVRASFRATELIKVRVAADDNATCDAVARGLAEHIPCEIVKRVGRVIVLYRARAANPTEQTATDTD